MKEKQPLNPHDTFFKLKMEVREHAAEIITAMVSQKILQKLDLNSLRNIESTFVDSKSSNFQADVVFECKYGDGQPVVVTVLFEHKSYIEKYPHLQLLRYMLGIWEKQKKNGERLCPIIPILLYQGQATWNYRPFEEYFEGGMIDQELLMFIPRFRFLFLNLQQKGDNWIIRNIKIRGLRMALLLMRHIQSPKLLNHLGTIFRDRTELLKMEGGKEQFEENYLYLFKGSKIPEEKIEEVMNREVFLNMPNPVGSAAWQREKKLVAKAKEEGKREGIREGKIESKLEVAQSMLKLGIAPSLVAEATGLSLETIQSLKS